MHDLQELNIRKMILGVTGAIGTGKTYACRQLIKTGNVRGINCDYISIDEIRRNILGIDKKYESIRKKVKQICNSQVINSDGTIDRRALGDIIFSNASKMKDFREIVNPIIRAELEEKIEKAKGLIIVEWALLAEDGLLDMVDNNVLLIRCTKLRQIERLKNSDLPIKQIKQRIRYGLSSKEKGKKIKAELKLYERCNLFVFDTTKDPKDYEYESLFNEIIMKI